MIKWKNTPIENLSKKDLQMALAESVTHIMRGDKGQNPDSVGFAFLSGAFASSGLFALIYLMVFLTK